MVNVSILISTNKVNFTHSLLTSVPREYSSYSCAWQMEEQRRKCVSICIYIKWGCRGPESEMRIGGIFIRHKKRESSERRVRA